MRSSHDYFSIVEKRTSQSNSVARCAVFPPNLAIFCLAGGGLAIFAIFWRKICRIFVQDLDQCCFIENWKNQLNVVYATAPKLIFSSCVCCIYQCRLFQSSGNPVFG